MFGDEATLFYTRGRYALFEACRLAGVGAAGALLAPSYHCRTMIDPALRLGAPVVLYPLGADLVPDTGRLAALAASSPVPVRAMLLTHYFGFPQPVREVEAFCAARGIILIEDCSHALYGEVGGRRLGTIGAYAVASPYKFLPCPDGGVLRANGGHPMPRGPLKRQGAISELKALARGWQQGLGRQHLRQEAAAKLSDCLAGLLTRSLPPPRQETVDTATPSGYYRVAEEGVAGHPWSRRLAGSADAEASAARRRQHYESLLAGVAGLPHCRPLFPRLPDTCVPYMFPLRIDHPEPHFQLLKHLGFPIWRWDELAVSDCPTASDYRLRLLHLPCHQALSGAELEWMLRALSLVMAIPPSVAARLAAGCDGRQRAVAVK